MIDIAFYGTRIFGVRWQSRSEKAVCRCWRDYFDSLQIDNHNFSNDQNDRLFQSRLDKFIALLASIAIEQNYDFDALDLRKYMYSPVAHGRMEEETDAIRSGLAKLLQGRQPLPMFVVNLPRANPPSNSDDKASPPT